MSRAIPKLPSSPASPPLVPTPAPSSPFPRAASLPELASGLVDEAEGLVFDAQLRVLLTPPLSASHKKRRTFTDMILKARPGRKTGYTFRELCSALHIASESLRAAKRAPGRLTLNGVLALSELLDEEPLAVAADLMAEIRAKRRATPPASTSVRARVGKPKDADETND